MVSKEQQKKLWWEWERSGGKTRYRWRYATEEGLGRGSFAYLLTRMCGFLFSRHSDPILLGGLGNIVVWLLISVIVSFFLSAWTWDYHEQQYLDSISKIPGETASLNNLPNPANPV